MNDITQKNTYRLLAGIGLLFFVGCIAVYFHYHHTRNKVVTQIQQKALKQTKEVAEQLDSFIMHLPTVARSVAHTLSTHTMSKSDIEALLIAQKPADFFGLGAAFTPYALNKKDRLYAPYYKETPDAHELVAIESFYDYTLIDDPRAIWFTKPIATGQEQFITPFTGTISDTILLEYVVPFYKQSTGSSEKKLAGVVFANQSIEHLNHILASQYRDQTGYWFLLSNEGIILAHPEEHRFTRHVTSMLDVARTQNNKPLKRSIKQALKQESAFTEYNNEINESPSWLFLEPLKNSTFILGHVYDISELAFVEIAPGEQLPDFDRHYLFIIITLMLCAILAVVGSVIIYFLPIAVSTFWYTSALVSFILIMAIAALWYSTQQYSNYHTERKPIQNKQDIIKTFATKQKRIEKDEHAFTIYDFDLRYLNKNNNGFLIPTGIFINSMRIFSNNTMSFTGYIWQHYINIDESIQRGFILPKANKAVIKKISKQKVGNDEQIIWFVEATLNQNLAYKNYPFDVKDLQIDILPQDITRNITLIPDFDSYELINPRALPGINEKLEVTGWLLEGSYFAYQTAHYGTLFGKYKPGQFGIYSDAQGTSEHEFSFNVMIKRHLIDAIIADLIPLIVIAMLLFVILVTAAQQSYGILGSCAAVFFGTILEHERFRLKTGAYQLLFFENLYLVMYVAILAIVVVSLLYLLRFNIHFIQYRTNLASQVLYWPVMLTIIYCISFIYLY